MHSQELLRLHVQRNTKDKEETGIWICSYHTMYYTTHNHYNILLEHSTVCTYRGTYLPIGMQIRRGRNPTSTRQKVSEIFEIHWLHCTITKDRCELTYSNGKQSRTLREAMRPKVGKEMDSVEAKC